VTRRHPIIVTVDDRQSLLRLSDRWVREIVRGALRAQRIRSAEIGVILIEDRAMAELNVQWLAHEGPTDVITFSLGEPHDPGCDCLRGDLAISVETAMREAIRHDWKPRNEVAYYLVHGLLHLTGHDDRTLSRRRRMRQREREVMVRIGLPEPPLT